MSIYYVVRDAPRHYSRSDLYELQQLDQIEPLRAELFFRKTRWNLSSDVIVWVGADIFIEVCSYKYVTPTFVLQQLQALNQKVEMFPSPELLYLVGTKRYTEFPFIQERMIPGTLLYPKDRQQILELPAEFDDDDMMLKKYVVKFGVSGSGKGVVSFWNEKYSKYLRNGRTLIEFLEKKRPKAYCVGDFAIIQPYFPQFEHHPELRFFVVGGEIVGLVLTHTPKFYQSYLIGKILDPRIEDFLGEIWNFFAERFEMTMLRIDLVVSNPSKTVLVDLGDSEIYINEVETIGSGLKAKITCQLVPTAEGLQFQIPESQVYIYPLMLNALKKF